MLVRVMMDNNFRYSREVLDVCLAQNIQFLYASSAATYGGSSRFVEEREVEQPLPERAEIGVAEVLTLVFQVRR